MTPEANGTIAMLCLAVFMALAAVTYFLYRWYKERLQSMDKAAKANKAMVSRTFSRFSGVDDELMLHDPDVSDEELIRAISPSVRIRMANNVDAACEPSRIPTVSESCEEPNGEVIGSQSETESYLETAL